MFTKNIETLLKDNNFIEKLKQGDNHAFHKLYTDTVDIFYRYLSMQYNISKPDKEDILHTTYVKFWNASKNRDHEQNIMALLRTILKNTCKDFFKKHKEDYLSQFEHEDGLSLEETITDQHGDALDIIDQRYTQQHIHDAINKLPQEYGEIIFLKYVEEQSYEQIADSLKTNQANIRKKCSRALQKLKEILTSQQ